MLQSIVVDNGTGSVKAGFAGAEEPALHFPNFVGRPKLPKIMMLGLDDEPLIGDKADEHRGILELNYPMSHGVVRSPENWSDMQKIWQYMFSELRVQSSSQHPVLLTEAPHNPRSNRTKAAEIFFESFNSPALYIQINAILSLYASGKVTGVVCDSGDGVTCAVPVYEGFALRPAMCRSDVAGRDVTEYLCLLLLKNGSNLHTSAEMEIIKKIKEEKCFVMPDIEKAEAEAREDTDPAITYTLPDGKAIEIFSEKFQAPEILFNPSLIGLECKAMHECVSEALTKSDLDIRKKLFSSIILAGGSTMFDGIGDRLLTELREASPRDTKIKIYAPKNRIISTWLGGSILAHLSTFKNMWVSRAEYKEEGARSIFRKCF